MCDVICDCPLDAGSLLTVQPQPAHHQAVHGLRSDGDGGGELHIFAQGASGPAVQHHEGDQPPSRQPPADALRPHPTGKRPSTAPTSAMLWHNCTVCGCGQTFKKL